MKLSELKNLVQQYPNLVLNKIVGVSSFTQRKRVHYEVRYKGLNNIEPLAVFTTNLNSANVYNNVMIVFLENGKNMKILLNELTLCLSIKELEKIFDKITFFLDEYIVFKKMHDSNFKKYEITLDFKENKK